MKTERAGVTSQIPSIRGEFSIRVVACVIAIMFSACLSRGYTEEALPSQKEFEPPSGKGRVVVVLSGHTGPTDYAYFAKDLAAQGYYSVLVNGNDFWVKGGSGKELLEGVITRAQQSPHALPGKVAVIGFSMGGAPALAYAARLPELVSAVVAYFPMTYYIKDPVNFVFNIKVPTLVLPGGRDTYKDCCRIAMARQLADAAKASQGKVMLEVHEYPDAGHGFIIKSSREWRSNDSADAFHRTLDHLRQYSGE